MYISTDCGGGLMCWSLRWWRCWWRSTPAYVPPAQYSLSRPSCDPIKSKGFDVNPSWPSHRNTSLTINTLNLRDCQHRLNEGSSLTVCWVTDVQTSLHYYWLSIIVLINRSLFRSQPTDIQSTVREEAKKRRDFELFYFNPSIIRAVSDY